MSGNLCRRDCAICKGKVILTGMPYVKYTGRNNCHKWVVADAECIDCKTKYTAGLGLRHSMHPEPFDDLFFRDNFNDEYSMADFYLGERPEVIIEKTVKVGERIISKTIVENWDN